jgi:hypothetical protein
MTRFFVFIVWSCLFLQTARGADDRFKSDQADIAAAIEKIQASQVKLFLYSLNPNDSRIFEGKLPENSEEVFHRYPILGRAEMISAEEKARLLESFAKGIRESNGLVAQCFNPRHGIRIIAGTTTNDFVICFECLQVRAYNPNADKAFLTSSSPNKVFNKLLDEYHIKKAE